MSLQALHITTTHRDTFKVISIYDLNNQEALQAASRLRYNAGRSSVDSEDLKLAVSYVGGRLAYLNKVSLHSELPSLREPTLMLFTFQVSKAKDMVGMARHLLEVEKQWLLSQIGLHIFILESAFRPLTFIDRTHSWLRWRCHGWGKWSIKTKRTLKKLTIGFSKNGARVPGSFSVSSSSRGKSKRRNQVVQLMIYLCPRYPMCAECPRLVSENWLIPYIMQWKCRQIMTRADFMEGLHTFNSFWLWTSGFSLFRPRPLKHHLHRRKLCSITLSSSFTPLSTHRFNIMCGQTPISYCTHRKKCAKKMGLMSSSTMLEIGSTKLRVCTGLANWLYVLSCISVSLSTLFTRRFLFQFKDLNKGDMVRLYVDKRGEEIVRTLESSWCSIPWMTALHHIHFLIFPYVLLLYSWHFCMYWPRAPTYTLYPAG